MDYPPYFDQLVKFIAAEHGMADRLTRDHANDGINHCRTCTIGAQAGRLIWPCQIYLAARHASNRASDLR